MDSVKSSTRSSSSFRIVEKSNCQDVTKNTVEGHSSSREKVEKVAQEEDHNRGVTENYGSSGAHQRLEKQIATSETTKCSKLKIKFSNNVPIAIQVVEPEPHRQSSPKVGESLEVLCQDSGIRGCWFRCKVLKASENRLKVQHMDVEDAKGSGKLEEWVPASRVAAPDRLSMRCSGRLTIRPRPPEDPLNYPFEVGAAVDTWWSDGWWEGVVTGFSLCRDDTYHVYLIGEGRSVTRQRKDIRISRDWVDNRWVDINPKPDILSIIFPRPGVKLATSSNADEGSKLADSALVDRKVFTNSKTNGLQGSPAAENMEKMSRDLKKRLRIRDGE